MTLPPFTGRPKSVLRSIDSHVHAALSWDSSGAGSTGPGPVPPDPTANGISESGSREKRRGPKAITTTAATRTSTPTSIQKNAPSVGNGRMLLQAFLDAWYIQAISRLPRVLL